MRDARYVKIPGHATHELPPLLVHGHSEAPAMENVLGLASVIVETDEMLPEVDTDRALFEQRRFDLALQLTDQYRGLVEHWQWGDSILEWVRQCEITFDSDADLRSLLHPDVWPHASRSSFVRLLREKEIRTPVGVEKAVGLRLTFRMPPPIDCFSNQFLIYLNSTVADSAYHTWSHLGAEAHSLLPPERFHFDVVDLSN